MTNHDPHRALSYYLRKRLEYLEQFNAHFESHLSDEKQNLCMKVSDGELDQNNSEIGKIVHHLDFVLGNTHRYTLLVGICSFLEESMKEITKRLITDYAAQIDKEKGNWLRRHIRVLNKSTGIDDFKLHDDLKTFHDLICLRNCIVHSWGNIKEAKSPDEVRAALKGVESASETKDGYLFLGDQVIPAAIIAAENIVDAIMTSKLGNSII